MLPLRPERSGENDPIAEAITDPVTSDRIGFGSVLGRLERITALLAAVIAKCDSRARDVDVSRAAQWAPHHRECYARGRPVSMGPTSLTMAADQNDRNGAPARGSAHESEILAAAIWAGWALKSFELLHSSSAASDS